MKALKALKALILEIESPLSIFISRRSSTLILEPLEPLTIRIEGQIWTLMPGQPFELPEAPAQKLLHLVPTKVRPLSEASVRGATLSIGQTIRWHSPLFGDVHGLVALPPDRGMVCVCEHSVTGDTVWIPLEWVVPIQEPKEKSV